MHRRIDVHTRQGKTQNAAEPVVVKPEWRASSVPRQEQKHKSRRSRPAERLRTPFSHPPIHSFLAPLPIHRPHLPIPRRHGRMRHQRLNPSCRHRASARPSGPPVFRIPSPGHLLPSNRDAVDGHRGRAILLPLLALLLVDARLAVQVAALLDGAAADAAARDAHLHVAVAGAAVDAADAGRAEVRDVLREGVLGADAARVDARRLARLGQRVVAAVEVLALLEVLGEVVGFRGQLAVEPEEALLVWGEGLWMGAWSVYCSTFFFFGCDVEDAGGWRAGWWGRLTAMSTLFFWWGFMAVLAECCFSEYENRGICRFVCFGCEMFRLR